MQAIELTIPGASISDAMRDEGILVNCTADRVIRFIPPLIVTREEIDEMIQVLDRVLTRFHEDG
jgi:acetylornithine/succinyldiaminopimelate/putrescine aminotransferase